MLIIPRRIELRRSPAVKEQPVAEPLCDQCLLSHMRPRSPHDIARHAANFQTVSTLGPPASHRRQLGQIRLGLISNLMTRRVRINLRLKLRRILPRQNRRLGREPMLDRIEPRHISRWSNRSRTLQSHDVTVTRSRSGFSLTEFPELPRAKTICAASRSGFTLMIPPNSFVQNQLRPQVGQASALTIRLKSPSCKGPTIPPVMQ